MAVNDETLNAISAMRKEVAEALVNATSQIERQWLTLLKSTLSELESIPAGPGRVRRLETVINQAADQLGTMGVSLTQLPVASVAASGVEGSFKIMASQLPKGWSQLVKPSVDQIIKRTQDKIVSEAYALSQDSMRAMKDNLIFAQAAGDSPLTAASRMLKDSVDGVFNGGIARANNIARTEMLDAHRGASEAVQNAHSDVLRGWMWFASLSDNTCMSCIAQHGTEYALEVPGPLDHQQGKCSRVPLTKSWKELGFDISEPHDLKVESGEDWFKRQSPETQLKLMGPKRYEAWQAGNFEPSQWSQLVKNDNWRDSYRVGSPGSGVAKIGSLNNPIDPWSTLTPDPDFYDSPRVEAWLAKKDEGLMFEWNRGEGVGSDYNPYMALDTYQQSAKVSTSLREVLTNPNPDTAPYGIWDTLDGMDEMFKSHPFTTSENMLLMRGVQGDFVDSFSVGKIVADPGFVSTTTNPDISDWFTKFDGGVADGHTLKIQVPQNTKVLLGVDDEYEVILNRNSLFEVISRDEDSREITLRLLEG